MQRYQTLANTYQSLADEALADPTKLQANVEKMKTLNAEMATILDKEIADMTSAGASGDIATLRDELIEKLRKIQKDYNGLLVNTDKLETLRRIRGFQEKDWKSELRLYIIFFGILAGILLLFLLFKRQSMVSTNVAPTSATATPILV
jgi:hypothetical protein